MKEDATIIQPHPPSNVDFISGSDCYTKIEKSKMVIIFNDFFRVILVPFILLYDRKISKIGSDSETSVADDLGMGTDVITCLMWKVSIYFLKWE